MQTSRRQFLKLAAGTAAAVATSGLLPASIARALAIPADRTQGSINDIAHVVILMMENRAFDHYFGTLKGVRGFGDPHPIPLPNGKSVWHQSDGIREIPPFHLDTATTTALLVPMTPHSFKDSQAAWGQGRINEWPRHKTGFSMGHYQREDIPFQFALAETFTICDNYHCQITTGTDPNRIAFWSGSNFDPVARARGENSTPDNSEPDNLRCWIHGKLPTPGYTYAGNALTWPTIPDVLERAGVSWKIFQDPNDNWTGAMHGCLAFESFRSAQPGSAIYEKGMRHWSLDHFAEEAAAGQLPQVSWILPPALWSEHPERSSPAHGAEFVSRILDALTHNPDTWSRTAFIVTFDENDGQFDHVPPPAPPSYDPDGSLAGKSTLNLAGHYFDDKQRQHLSPADTASGNIRPWGLGPRVPCYVVSPWSTGGWVCSEVFDHSSVGQFLEKRFQITIPAISPWHRLVSGDLLSAFDFSRPGSVAPALAPAASASAAWLQAIQHPYVTVPENSSLPVQETGTRPSRALPYVLHANARPAGGSARQVSLIFRNVGTAGAVFQVYDRFHLDRTPRRYTVEPGKVLQDEWLGEGEGGAYDLQVFGPGGFMRRFQGSLATPAAQGLEIGLDYLPDSGAIELVARNRGNAVAKLNLCANAYDQEGMQPLEVPAGQQVSRRWHLVASGYWYDFTVGTDGIEQRFAGRMETGAHSISDPAMGGPARETA